MVAAGKKPPAPPRAALSNRLRLLDLMAGVFLPATIASAWPGLPPLARAVLFGLLVIFSCASVWWAATLANTYGINDGLRRMGVQVYAFAAVLSFTVFTPACFFVSIGCIFKLFFVNRPNGLASPAEWNQLLLGLIILLPTGLMTASLIGVELCRLRFIARQEEETRLAEAQLPLPEAPARPEPNVDDRMKPHRKNRSRKRRARARRERSVIPRRPKLF